MWPTEDLGKICPALPHNVISDLALNRVNSVQKIKYLFEECSKVSKFLNFFWNLSLTLFRARSGITLWGRAGQILPKSSVGHINSLNDLLVLRTYSQVNILDFTSPWIPKKLTFDDFFAAGGWGIKLVINWNLVAKKLKI